MAKRENDFGPIRDPLQKSDDPRDLNTLPVKFDNGLGRSTPRPPADVGDGIGYARIYWVYGGNTVRPSEVSDPPCSGWSSVFVIEEPDGRVRLFCPYSMQSWLVSKNSYEWMSVSGSIETFEWRMKPFFLDYFPRQWAACRRRGWNHCDYATAERVMWAMGIDPPPEDQWALLAPNSTPSAQRLAGTLEGASSPAPAVKAQGGKPPAPVGASPAKPVKRAGRKGEVLKHFLDAPGHSVSVNEAMAKFGVSRSNLLSQLFLLRKDHGIGYTVKGDVAAVQLPEGVTDPFEKEEA